MRFFSAFLLLLIFGFYTGANAQTSDFNIRVFPNDTIPPSTPTLLSADPIASTQIDVSWSAATDNFYVSGYVLYRDNSPIATTTQTSYSDTGLTASTTYNYYVQSFDANANYSSTSNAIATTTSNPPAPPPVATSSTSSSSEGTAARVVLDEVLIEEGYTDSLFTITTKRPARIELRWGRTTSYELGYVANNAFLSEYKTTITDLEPGTTYEYQIVGYTARDIEFVLESGQFTTKAQEILLPPGNITRFSYSSEGADVRLFWNLPIDTNVQHVRVLRSYLGYPTHPWDGSVVYQGVGDAAVDEGILDIYSPVYYTAFVTDENGLISSGAVLRVIDTRNTPSESTGSEFVANEIEGDGVEIYDEGATTTTPTDPFSGAYRIPDLSEVFLEQNGVRYTFAQDDINLVSNRAFVISIPAGSVAPNLKTILVTLADPTDTRQRYAFLLKINSDQTAYEATISPLELLGQSVIQLDIYDYEKRVVSSYKKKIVFAGVAEAEQVVLFPDFFIEHIGLTIGLLLLPLLLLLFFLYKGRRRKRQ